MRARFMRVIVFFDLPVLTKADMRNYRKFRKYLISQGFVMMQKSVYSKITLNGSSSKTVISNVKKNKPPAGILQILTVTEKQYQSIEYILGQNQSEVLDTVDRVVMI